MLKALLRVRLAAFSSWLTGGGRGKRMTKGKKIGFALLMLYAGGAFAFMFFGFFSSIAGAFAAAGLEWLYFAFYGITAFAMMFIGSVFAAKAQIFEARDNELLLAMPIPPAQILGSRMLVLLFMNLLFDLLTAIPAGIAWCNAGNSVTAAGCAGFLLVSVALVLFSTAMSCLIGWLVALLTSRMRNQSLMTVLFSLIFLGLYFYFFSQINSYLTKLLENASQVAHALQASPIYWLGRAAAGQSPGLLVLTLGLLLVPFVLVYIVLSATFLRLVTNRRGAKKIRYKEKTLKVSGQAAALLKREMTHLLRSPSYLLNSGLGVVMMLAAAVAALIMRHRLLTALSAFPIGEMAAPIAVLVVCLLSGMTLFTAPSVSLEGKSIWILQSLPVPTKQILRAKLRLHNCLTMPAAFILSAVLALVLQVSVVQCVLMLLTPLAFTALSANIGLMSNLRHPNLDWINETQAVKQGIAVLIAMGLDFLLAAVPGAVYFIWLSGTMRGEVFMLVLLAGFTLLAWLTGRWLMRRGTGCFEEL